MALSPTVAYGEGVKNLDENLRTHVIELSREIGERNYIYYKALNKAVDYITDEFAKYGYAPQTQDYYIYDKQYKNIDDR